MATSDTTATPAVRMAADADNIIEGWLVPFSGSFNDGRDSYGTKFSARTNYCLDWFAQRPALFQHGLDPEAGLVPVGVIRSLEMRDQGVWMQAQLDAQSEYFGAIRDLVQDGKLFLSSGSVEHLVQIDARTGHVDVWPIVEGSLTPTPSNLCATIDNATFRTACRSAGVTLDQALLDRLGDAPVVSDHALVPATRTDRPRLVTRPTSGDTDGAVSPVERSFEDIRDDLTELLNPSSPFGAYAYTYILATYTDHVIVCRYEDGEDSTYWTVDYTLNETNEPVLGAATQVEQVYQPVAARSAAGPLALDAAGVIRQATALAQRTQDLGERRYREGRVLSDANRKTLADAHTQLGVAHQSIGDLLDQTARMADEAARAARLTDPAEVERELSFLRLLID